MTDDPKPWPLKSSTRHGDFRIFRVREDAKVSPVTGEELPFFILECHDWINVLPITADGQAVLIRQWRHGTNEITWEIPGGLIDPGETPEQAAARELLEETGYTPKRIQYAGAVTPNPAFITNRCHTCIAYDCEKTSAPSFDPGEDITTHLVPLERLREMVRDGEITHSLVVAAFYLSDLMQEQPSDTDR